MPHKHLAIQNRINILRRKEAQRNCSDCCHRVLQHTYQRTALSGIVHAKGCERFCGKGEVHLGVSLTPIKEARSKKGICGPGGDLWEHGEGVSEIRYLGPEPEPASTSVETKNWWEFWK